MSSNNEGVAVLSFGTTTITGYVVESVNETTGSESVLVYDEDNAVVADINTHGINTQVELTVIPKSGTTAPEPGDVFTYTSETYGSKNISVIEVQPSSNNKDVTRWTIRGHRHPGITLTP